MWGWEGLQVLGYLGEGGEGRLRDVGRCIFGEGYGGIGGIDLEGMYFD